MSFPSEAKDLDTSQLESMLDNLHFIQQFTYEDDLQCVI